MTWLVFPPSATVVGGREEVMQPCPFQAPFSASRAEKAVTCEWTSQCVYTTTLPA